MSDRLIRDDKSLILAADMEPDNFQRFVEATGDIEGISAYKLGISLSLSYLSLPRCVEIVYEQSNKLPIYDHQKGGTDIPETGPIFARRMRQAGVEAAIIYPFTGPNVEEAWIKAMQNENVEPIVGAEMTHPNIAGDHGYIRDDAFKRMYAQAIELGVKNFGVPGNKPDMVRAYRSFFDTELGEGEFDLFALGFVSQGGSIIEADRVAGQRWHAVVGRGIFEERDVRQAAVEYTSQILRLM